MHYGDLLLLQLKLAGSYNIHTSESSMCEKIVSELKEIFGRNALDRDKLSKIYDVSVQRPHSEHSNIH